MANDDLTARAGDRLVRLATVLRTPSRRWLIVGSGIIVAVVLHSVLEDPSIAWLAAIPILGAGIAGGGAFGLAAGAVAAVGHLGVDIALGDPAWLGIVSRTLALPTLGVLGSVVSRFEEQRDKAVFRSATEDSITGLLNVRAFYDELAELRARNVPYCILLADIAGMGDLNERYGHPTGTEALRTLGHVLRRNVKRRDKVARLGSDEIAIALVDTDVEGAIAAATRLSARLAEESLALPDGQRFQVHAYYGISSFRGDGHDEVSVLREADHAVNEAKERGPDEIGVARQREHPGAGDR